MTRVRFSQADLRTLGQHIKEEEPIGEFSVAYAAYLQTVDQVHQRFDQQDDRSQLGRRVDKSHRNERSW